MEACTRVRDRSLDYKQVVVQGSCSWDMCLVGGSKRTDSVLSLQTERVAGVGEATSSCQ